MKANSNLAVIRLFGEMGAGADIVSVGEMRRALAAGIPAGRIIYSGVGKKAVGADGGAARPGVGQINVESSAELETLNAVAGQLGVKADITIRVNPDVDAGTHAKITTGRKENKFGIDIDLAREAFALAGRLPNLKVVGRGHAYRLAAHLARALPRRHRAGARADRPAARRRPPHRPLRHRRRPGDRLCRREAALDRRLPGRGRAGDRRGWAAN